MRPNAEKWIANWPIVLGPHHRRRNLLDYALLKGLAERILVSSIERRANEVAIKFHPETTLPPEKLVGLNTVQGEGMRLDPSGTLWMRIERRGRIAESVRNVLLRWK